MTHLNPLADQQPEALVGAFLRAVSFQEGERPRYDALTSMFTVGALLVDATGDCVEVMTLDQFVTSRQGRFESGALTCFEEIELSGVSDAYGHIAHRFSTYAKRGTLHGASIDTRGAISTQLVRTSKGWKIASMTWDDERGPQVRPPRL